MEIESSKNSYKYDETYGSYNNSAVFKYFNSVSSGTALYCAPSYAEKWLKIDSTGSYELPFTDIDVNVNDKNRLTVLGANGRIYGIPYQTQFVNEVDPATDIVRHVSGPTLPLNDGSFIHGTLAANGKIYCPKYIGGEIILVIDTTIDVATYYTISITGVSGQYSAATEATNGKIYCVPRTGGRILVIDTSDDSYYLISGTIPGQYSSSALSATNGKIYSPPSYPSWFYILVIDPTDDSYYYLPGPAGDLYRYMQESTVAHPNGKIYSIPYEKFNPALVINTVDDSTKWVGNAEFLSMHTIHLSDNGKIYGAPWQPYAKVVEIDPDTDTMRYLEKRNEWNGNMTGTYCQLYLNDKKSVNSQANWDIVTYDVVDTNGVLSGAITGTFDTTTNTGIGFTDITFTYNAVDGKLSWSNSSTWQNINYIPDSYYRYRDNVNRSGDDLAYYQNLDIKTGINFLKERCDEIGGAGFLMNKVSGEAWIKSNVNPTANDNNVTLFKKYDYTDITSNNYCHINNIGNDFYLIPNSNATVGRITIGGKAPSKNTITLNSTDGNTRQKIRYIKDYVNGHGTSSTGSEWVEINAYENGVNVALNKPVTTNISFTFGTPARITDGDINSANYNGGNGDAYVIVDLEELYNIEKIRVWHYYADSRTYRGTRTQTSPDGVTWTDVFNSAYQPGTYVETPNGKTTTLYTESFFKSYNNFAAIGYDDEVVVNMSLEEAKQHCINNKYISFERNGATTRFSYTADTSLGTYVAFYKFYINSQILPTSISTDTNYINPIPYLPTTEKSLNYNVETREIQCRNSDTLNMPRTVDFGGNTFVGNPPRPRVIFSFITSTNLAGEYLDVSTTLLVSEYYAPIIQSFQTTQGATGLSEAKSFSDDGITWFFRVKPIEASTIIVWYVAISK